MARHEHKKRQRAGHRAFLAAGAARLTFDSELRACGFEAAEIEAAWSCRDDIERVAIELMILAAGLASIDDLASEVVRRARNTLGWAGVVQMPFEKFEPLARRAWDEWETLTGRPLQERPSSVLAAGVIALLEDAEQKLGWADYPAGTAGRAARIIVRRELLAVIEQAYPALKNECRQLFRDEWNRWRALNRTRGARALSRRLLHLTSNRMAR